MKKAVSMVLLGSLGLSGCFTYAPLAPAQAPSRADQVRVVLSRPIDVPITDVTVRDVAQVQGEVISNDASALRVSAYGLRNAVGYSVLANGETVTIPRDQVAMVRRKRVDSVRSGLFAVGVVGIGLVVAGLGGAFSNSAGKNQPPPSQQ